MTLLLRATSPDLLPPVDAAVPHQRTATDSTTLSAVSTAPATETTEVAETTPTTASSDDTDSADTTDTAPAAESVAPGPSVAALPAPRIPTSEAEARTAPSDETSDADQTNDVYPDETMGEAPVATDDADPANPSAAIAQTVQVRRGDTLITVLVNAGVSHDDAYSAIEALQDLFAPKNLRPGQEIALTFSAPEKQHQGTIDFQLVSLSLQPSVDRDLQVTRALDGGFTAFAIDKPLTHRNVAVRGEIHSSLFEAAQDAGVPVAIISAAIKALSYDVDFQRDIQPGDTFEFVFDRLDDEDGNLAKPGDLLYASLTLSGR